MYRLPTLFFLILTATPNIYIARNETVCYSFGSTIPVNILSLFKSFRAVGIGEFHYNQELWDMVERLIDEPEFPHAVRNITFEGGNSLYQGLIDRYILLGQGTDASIKQIWRNNTQINTTFDAPVYLRMLKHIRELNRKLPLENRVRILLLDPPIDWGNIKSEDQYLKFLMQREPQMIKVIEDEVYKKGQNVLFIAGSSHIFKNEPNAKFKTALSVLETNHPQTTYAIGVYNGSGIAPVELKKYELQILKRGKPAFIKLKNSEFSNWPSGIDIMVSSPDDHQKQLTLGEVYDALLFFGKREELTISDPALGVCTDKPEDIEWRKVIMSRQQLTNLPPFLRVEKDKICRPLPKFYFQQEEYK